jgi:hypothetical protein
MSMNRRRWAVRVVTALLAAAAVPVVAGGAAQAAVSGLHLFETSVTVSANGQQTVAVNCPYSGWTAVSGGWHVSSGNYLNSLVIHQSWPWSGGWGFTIANKASVQQQVTLRITCVRDFVDTISVVRSASVTIQPGASGAATATCPSGTKILGGGYSLNSPNGVTLSSAPWTGPHRWVGIFRNNGTTTVAYTYAVCGKAVTHYLNSVTTTINPGKEGVSNAGCFQEYVSGGGWSHSFTAYSPLRQAFSYTNKTWRNTVKAPPSSSIQITTYAICIGLA